LQEIVDAFVDAPSTSEMGAKAERLMVEYIRLGPTLSALYDEVMRWTEWPHRGTSPDVGIGFVAADKGGQRVGPVVLRTSSDTGKATVFG
jgi:predicted helicase